MFPCVGIATYIQNLVWFFKRGNTSSDFEKFYKWIDAKFENRFPGRYCLNIYPEGHRNLGREALRLRTGMLRYAWDR
jgi:hypothetical protein